MANWFLDLVNGSDGQDGSTFAKRKKTLNSFTSGPTIGDTIRVMANAAPYDTGTTAAFTKKSITVTLTAAQTANIYLDGAWTQGTNVTATTDAVNKKEGSNSSSLSVAAAFTTGQIGYYATGTIDLSSYTKISFWIKTSIAVAANSLRLDLCTDTVGATAVNSVTIDFATTANGWNLCTFDTGGALNASIKSVNLQALLDPGTVVILLDDIVACKSNNINLSSLIGINDGYWWGIKSINGTTVVLDSDISSLQAAGQGWWSPTGNHTGTFELWGLDPIRATATQTSNASLTAGTNISGGWNTTDMTTQTGYTWIDGCGISFVGWTLNNNRVANVDHLAVCRLINSGIQLTSNTTAGTLTYFQGSNTGARVYVMGSHQNASYGVCIASTGVNIGAMGNISFDSTITNGIAISNVGANAGAFNNNNGGAGFPIRSKFINCLSANNVLFGFGATVPNSLELVNCSAWENASAGSKGGTGTLIFNFSASGNGTGAIDLTGGNCRIYGLTASGNTGGTFTSTGNPPPAGVVFVKNLRSSDPAMYFNASGALYTTALTIYSTQENGDINQNQIYQGNSFFTITATGQGTQSGSGLCWQCKPTDATLGPNMPGRLSVGRFEVDSTIVNHAISITYYVARSSANITGVLRIFGGVTAGVGSYGTDITTTCTPTAATHNPPLTSEYTQYTIGPFTPTEKGVIEVFFEFYSTDTTSYIMIDTAGASAS